MHFITRELFPLLNSKREYKKVMLLWAEHANWSNNLAAKNSLKSFKFDSKMTQKRWLQLMASKKGDFGFSFVNWQPDEKAKKDIKSAQLGYEDMYEWKYDLIANGYKFSENYSEKQNCYTVSMSCNDKPSENYGLVFTAFHSNPIICLAICYYFDRQVCEGDWTTVDKERFDW